MVTYAGKLIKDAELKTVGAKGYHKTVFTLNTGRNEPLVSVITWFELADECCNLVKGDRVLVCGKEESREYNGKTYTDVSAEFVLKHNPIKYDVKPEEFVDLDISPEDIPF